MDLQNLSRPYTLLWLAQGDSPMIRAGVSVCGRLSVANLRVVLFPIGVPPRGYRVAARQALVHLRKPVGRGYRLSGFGTPRRKRCLSTAVNASPAGFHLCRVGRAAWKDTRVFRTLALSGGRMRALAAPPERGQWVVVASRVGGQRDRLVSPVRWSSRALNRRSRYRIRPRPTLLVRP